MAKEIMQSLTQYLEQHEEYDINIDPLSASSDDVYQLVVNKLDEFPIAVSEADGELLCMVRIAHISEFKSDKIKELYELLLSSNLALPLSSFGLVDNVVYLFGALSSASAIELVVREIEMLHLNTIEALEILEELLQK